MQEGNRQLRGAGADEADSLMMWDFTTVGESPAVPRKGTFSNQSVIPGTSQFGYDDYAVGFLTVERELYTNGAKPLEKTEIIRTATGKKFYVQAVDDSAPVVYVLTLTIRELGTRPTR